MSALVDELMKSLQDRLAFGRTQQKIQNILSAQPQTLYCWANEAYGPENMFTRNRNLTAFLGGSGDERPKLSGGPRICKAEILAWGLHAIRESFSMKQIRVI